MNEDTVLFQTNWVKVRGSSKGFHYLERKGKDSIAVFLVQNSSVSKLQHETQNAHHETKYEVLIRQQPLCIDNREINGSLVLYPCPITGAIDSGESPLEAANREVYEEAGYRVEVQPLGRYIIGTQTNEICYLYYADVTGIKPDPAPQDGSYFESISRNEWHPLEYLCQCEYSACQIGYFKLSLLLAQPLCSID